MAAQQEYLAFTFAPHVLEDLGVNLYTSVAKALVEFVANAHDADAQWVNVSFDADAIKLARDTLKAQHEFNKAKAKKEGAAFVEPLAEQILGDDIQIIIQDNGVGMSREDLESKFLVIGRRRRRGMAMNARTDGGRIIMGRKGLGKLAGFGIAHVIEVTSKVATETHATRITLDLDTLLNSGHPPEEGNQAGDPAKQARVQVPVITLPDGGGLEKGTRIVLKSLVYDAVRGELSQSLTQALAENFYGIKTEDFAIRINDAPVDTTSADFAYAYPKNGEVPKTDLVQETLPSDDLFGSPISFEYRIRFRQPKNQLPARARGMRVYAHNRLASVPDLLDVKSSAHGFQYTSYLEGVVVADFIDEQPTDYISTDRQSLRWDTPVLMQLRDFLTAQMNKALNDYANAVSESMENRLKDDAYTRQVITAGRLPEHRERNAWQIAKTLAGRDAGDLESDFYRSTIKSVVSGIGHGEILGTIQHLAEQDEPELREVIREITKLSRHEFDEFMTIVDARLAAIGALSKLVEGVDFKASKNEKDLHVLFEKSPWLIDPTYFEFLTSNQGENELNTRLSKELEIGKFVPQGYDPEKEEETKPFAANKRPDLTFLLANQSLKRLVIVELKAPNTPLHIDHLTQLKGYMAKAEKFLKKSNGDVKVEGILIGSYQSDTLAEKVVQLDYEIEKQMGPNSPWRVFDILEVLKRTRDAHREILDVYQKASGSALPSAQQPGAAKKAASA